MLLHLYAIYASPEPATALDTVNPTDPRVVNGRADRVVRDADEFELEGLMSEDEEEAVGKRVNGAVG